MVARRYFSEEEPSFRRFSSRGISYPTTIQDRSFPSQASVDPSHGSRGYHATRNGDRSTEQDSQGPRRRIQVACGRCRKRKIRCSGAEQGGICQGCKSAGSEVCQFLRVSSTETPMKSDLTDLNFDSAGTRQLQLPLRIMNPNPHFGNYPPVYPQQGTSLASEGWAGYRSAYQSEFSNVDGSGVDYNAQSPNYQLQSQEYLGATPYVSPSNRGWGTYQQNTSTNDSSEQTGGSDRLLPYPAVNRPAQQNGSFLRSSDILPSSQSGYRSSISESGPMGTGNSYMPLSDSPESVSTPLSYSTQSDMYTPSSDRSGSLFFGVGQSMRNNSTSDLSYSYRSSSQTNAESTLPALANGHAYVPHNSYHNPAVTSPLDVRLPSHRTSSGSLQTV